MVNPTHCTSSLHQPGATVRKAILVTEVRQAPIRTIPAKVVRESGR
ncbi:MAG: hypothetical protein ACYCTV_07900 [Leptospirales bacterium]